MSEFERFIRAILGLYPRPVSRREYVNLVCDNAAPNIGTGAKRAGARGCCG